LKSHKLSSSKIVIHGQLVIKHFLCGCASFYDFSKLIAAARGLDIEGMSLFFCRLTQNQANFAFRILQTPLKHAKNRCSATVFGQIVVELGGVEPPSESTLT